MAQVILDYQTFPKFALALQGGPESFSAAGPKGRLTMATIPIVAQHRAEPTSGQLADVDRLTEELRRERPELGLHEEFRPLLPRVLEDAPTLHLDDLSEIPM